MSGGQDGPWPPNVASVERRKDFRELGARRVGERLHGKTRRADGNTGYVQAGLDRLGQSTFEDKVQQRQLPVERPTRIKETTLARCLVQLDVVPGDKISRRRAPACRPCRERFKGQRI